MRSLPTRARAYIVLVLVLGLAGAVLLGARSDLDVATRDLPATIALCVLVMIGELRPLVVTRRDTVDEITLSTGFALALAMVGGLWLAVLVMCTAGAIEDVRAGKPWVKVSFNLAQYVLTLLAAGACFHLVTGAALESQPPHLVMPGDLPGALAAGLVLFTVNTVLTGAVSALVGGEKIRERLRADLRFQLATAGLLLTFAPLLAFSLEVTLWLLPLLVLPMVAIYVSVGAAARRESESLHDALTGLANRTLFGLRVGRVCERPDATDGLKAVMLLDLDHFKEINDTLGHHVGDQLLTAVGLRLRDGVRDGDTVARLGGDEFAVLSVQGLGGPQDALDLGNRLLAALADPFDVDGVQLNVEGSVGIALFPQHGDGADLLLRQADIALYDAKQQRSCCRLYDPQKDPHTLQRLALATDMRAGLERHELFLHHQPKIDLSSGRVVGFEALVRWQHPKFGMLMPDEFLPVVENTGLIGPMTLEVLDLALAAVSRWREGGRDVTVAVNLSARHLTDLSLPRVVAERLSSFRLPPSALELEVTETLIMTDPTRAGAVLAGLRGLGVAIAVDDFGTGYSSLAYLRRLSIDELKIDKSFVTQLSCSDEDAVIVRSTIELGHNLGLRLVAEGVEDRGALDLLRAWGCDRAQGYFISRPMPEADVLGWLAQRDGAPGAAGGHHPSGCSTRPEPRPMTLNMQPEGGERVVHATADAGQKWD